MAYKSVSVDVDIDLDEFDTDELVDELCRRMRNTRTKETLTPKQRRAFNCTIEELKLVNHINNDVQCNFFKNLEWATNLENIQHAAKQGRMIAWNKKLSREQVNTIREMRERGYKMDALASIFNVTRPVIGNIINNKYYNNVN